LTERKRLDYLDVAKGIGIILVIIGHMPMSIVYIPIYSFHMPLFFIIGGYLMDNSIKKNFILSKVRGLLVPYVFTIFCLIIISIFDNIWNASSIHIIPDILRLIYTALYGSGLDYTYPFYIPSVGSIWFLWAMFFATIIYHRIMNEKHCWLYVVVLFIFGYITTKSMWLPLSIQSAMVAVVFVHIGQLTRKNKVFQIESCLITVINFVVWCICVFMSKGVWHMAGNVSYNIPVDIIGGIAGSYFVISLSKYISKIKIISGWLKKIGKYSCIILCSHTIELFVMPWSNILDTMNIYNESLRLLLMFSMKMIWCIMSVVLVLNVSILRKIFCIKEKAANS